MTKSDDVIAILEAMLEFAKTDIGRQTIDLSFEKNCIWQQQIARQHDDGNNTFVLVTATNFKQS